MIEQLPNTSEFWPLGQNRVPIRGKDIKDSKIAFLLEKLSIKNAIIVELKAALNRKSEKEEEHQKAIDMLKPLKY